MLSFFLSRTLNWFSVSFTRAPFSVCLLFLFARSLSLSPRTLSLTRPEKGGEGEAVSVCQFVCELAVVNFYWSDHPQYDDDDDLV